MKKLTQVFCTLMVRFKVSLLMLALSSLVFSQLTFAQLRYDTEYPAIAYSTAELSDPITLMVQAVTNGELELVYTEERGYLDSLLEALNIDPSSQLLVFSKTALKTRFVNSETPRALYFTDNAYVAFIQGSRSLEMSAMDPNIGPVFFVLSQDPEVEIEADRQMNRCLRCHDSYSLSGGGVPRFLLSSVLADPDGSIVSHEFSTITNTSTPINRRWGGWFVTGTHGSQEHMGNLIIDDVSMLANLDLSLRGNRSDLSGLVNVEPYISEYSDIVALLVLEHQIEVQNRMIKTSYEFRTLLDEQGSVNDEDLANMAEPLLASLLMANETALEDKVIGVSGFTEYFQGLGPFDGQGRSLRDFDLNTRTFKYPLSYQIYSDAFDTLPKAIKEYLFVRLDEVLSNTSQTDDFFHLSADDRIAIKEILQETKADFLF